MPKQEKVYIFLNSISVSCPKCGEETRYRRDGYDGEDGEGQYCNKCKRYITEFGMRMILTDDIENVRKRIELGLKEKK